MLNSQGLYWGCCIQHLEKHFEKGTKDYYSHFMDTVSYYRRHQDEGLSCTYFLSIGNQRGRWKSQDKEYSGKFADCFQQKDKHFIFCGLPHLDFYFFSHTNPS